MPEASWIPAARRYSLPDDGMALPWEGRIWLNPPYGTETARWLGKLLEHGNGIALVFARTDTAWGQSALRLADAVCFIAGRISFVPGSSFEGATTSAGTAPSMLLAFGEDCARAVGQVGLGVTFATPVEPPQLSL